MSLILRRWTVLLLALALATGSALSHSQTANDTSMTAPGRGDLGGTAGDTARTRLVHDVGPGAAMDTSEIRAGRVAIVTGTLATSIVAIHLYQQAGWWKDNRAKFHFQEDLIYGLNVDKIGHAYGGMVLAYVFSRSFEWSGMKETQSLWWGSGASLLFQTYVEVEDGCSTWGFDRVDWASDVAGAAYPLVQHYWEPLQNLNLKFSYHPSSLINEPGGSGFKGQKHILMDDYEGQTLWFSMNVRKALPDAVQKVWPEWLWVALGYGARDITSTNPYRVYFIAPDLHLPSLIPQTTPFLRQLATALNYIHLPLPAVMISPGTIWYGMYF